MIRNRALDLTMLVFVLGGLAGCKQPWPFLGDRYSKIPADAVKGTPATDPFPPRLVSDEYEEPVPMPGPVNSAGGEDSPFISRDGTELYFFFTPDVRVPAELQVLDSVTGIWYSRLVGGQWTEPERVILNDGEGLDGCAQLVGDTLWFASIRAKDMLGDIDVFTAVRRDGEWRNWRNAGEQLNVEYNIGEFHLTSDHRTMYFGSAETGDSLWVGYDLWKMERNANGWDAPVRLGPSINDSFSQSQPFVSSDMKELWYTGWCDSIMGPCVYRSRCDSLGVWQTPEQVVVRFAGEPTLDDAGNLYFVHHYYTGGDSSRMLEADIYLCRRRTVRE
jgi:hypothetical protein